MLGRVFYGISQRGGANLRVAVGLLACLVAFGACAVTGGGTGGSTTAGWQGDPDAKAVFDARHNHRAHLRFRPQPRRSDLRAAGSAVLAARNHQ